MSYRDRDSQREYQRFWMRERRAEWFGGRACRDCGTTARLELHHLDPAQKVSHTIWSWSEPRRLAEIAKCVVLCRPCHEAIHYPPKPEPEILDDTNALAWLAEWDRRKAARLAKRRAKSLRTPTS